MSSISYSTAPDSTPVKAPEQKFSTGTVPTTTAAVTSSSSQQGLWPSPANKNNSNTTHNSSTSINNSSSSPVRGGQTGIVATAGHNNPALSTMYAKASIALRSHRTAAEFDVCLCYRSTIYNITCLYMFHPYVYTDMILYLYTVIYT
mgnify:CR=1 FL=1